MWPTGLHSFIFSHEKTFLPSPFYLYLSPVNTLFKLKIKREENNYSMTLNLAPTDITWLGFYPYKYNQVNLQVCSGSGAFYAHKDPENDPRPTLIKRATSQIVQYTKWDWNCGMSLGLPNMCYARWTHEAAVTAHAGRHVFIDCLCVTLTKLQMEQRVTLWRKQNKKKFKSSRSFSDTPGQFYHQSFLFLKAVDKLRGKITSNRDVSVCETRKLLRKQKSV